MGQDVIGSLLHLLTFLLIMGGVFFIVYGVWELVVKRMMSEAQELEERSTIRALRKIVLRRLGTLNRRFIWPSYENHLRKRIIAAGGLGELQPEEILALQELSTVFFTIVGLMVVNFLRGDLKIDVGWWFVSVFIILGVFYPNIWLRDQVKKRHFKIIRELPYNMDLLTLSVEAGLDFQAAVATVVAKGKKGPLSDELNLMLRELRMGKTRMEALRNMADRVQLPALNQFVAALIQADRMGTSLGKVLRIQSTQMRVERTQRAEKLANEAPVKMLFPLIACIFPTVFMVLFGPIVYQLITGEF
ncbi:MAG: type II secretion system F family protein [Deltaproteobacteria bacterium]|nr:MAG: type II secretion system F family protein [Deltaproteobacteria bacterium]